MNVGILDINIIDDLAGNPPIDVGRHLFKALIDTGAQATMVSKSVAERVGLRPVGKVRILGVNGIEYHNNYLFQVAFVLADGAPGSTNPTVSVHVLDREISGAELNMEQADFDVLLGMDVLSNCSLAVEGGGTFSLSF